jgi:hypothetical protein
MEEIKEKPVVPCVDIQDQFDAQDSSKSSTNHKMYDFVNLILSNYLASFLGLFQMPRGSKR